MSQLQVKPANFPRWCRRSSVKNSHRKLYCTKKHLSMSLLVYRPLIEKLTAELSYNMLFESVWCSYHVKLTGVQIRDWGLTSNVENAHQGLLLNTRQRPAHHRIFSTTSVTTISPISMGMTFQTTITMAQIASMIIHITSILHITPAHTILMMTITMSMDMVIITRSVCARESEQQRWGYRTARWWGKGGLALGQPG